MRGGLLLVVFSVLVAGCGSPSRPGVRPDPALTPAPAPRATLPPATRLIALDRYKQVFAHRIVGAGAPVFDERLPEVLKSVVVLDITIDHDGHPVSVEVLRSNGFKHLDERAQQAVYRAAPFLPPLAAMGNGQANFLETFLFRDDGRFQIRSLVTAPQ